MDLLPLHLISERVGQQKTGGSLSLCRNLRNHLPGVACRSCLLRRLHGFPSSVCPAATELSVWDVVSAMTLFGTILRSIPALRTKLNTFFLINSLLHPKGASSWYFLTAVYHKISTDLYMAVFLFIFLVFEDRNSGKVFSCMKLREAIFDAKITR